MTAWICKACGVQYPPTAAQPAGCPICEDARQYVPPQGQQWTTLGELLRTHRNEWKQEEAGCWSIHTEPAFAIGQRAYLVQTAQGNILWDCLTLLDEATVAAVRKRGGLRAIAISHAHYYSTMVEWSEAFGGVPVYIHEDDSAWVQGSGPSVLFWAGETLALFGGLTLIRSGGHFAGYQVLHRPGVLFAGDQPQVCPDLLWATFMYSYPNLIPFNAATIERIDASLRPFEFDRLYGAFGRNVMSDAKGVIQRSKDR